MWMERKRPNAGWVLQSKWVEDIGISVLAKEVFQEGADWGIICPGADGGKQILSHTDRDWKPILRGSGQWLWSRSSRTYRRSSQPGIMLFPSQTRVYLSLGNTDMRKSINTLSVLVEGDLDLDPFSGHLFAFCNRRRNIVKILYWDRNGFCLWQKRLEKDKFKWPESYKEVLEIDQRQLSWLMDGLGIHQATRYKDLRYSTVL